MGSCHFGVTIRSEAKEADAYKVIKNYILSLDARFTCAEDPDEEFDAAIMGGDHIPVMNFKVSGHQLFKLYRPQPLLDDGAEVGISQICFSMDGYADVPSSTGTIHFMSSSYNDWRDSKTQSTDWGRGLVISHIINENFIYLSFTCIPDENGIFRRNQNRSIIYVISDGVVYVNSRGNLNPYDRSTVFNVSDMSIYSSAAPGMAGSFVSRFTYACPPGIIDYIKSSAYMSNGERIFTLDPLYDCTTVTTGDTVALEDGAYVAVGTHQLVKVLDS